MITVENCVATDDTGTCYYTPLGRYKKTMRYVDLEATWRKWDIEKAIICPEDISVLVRALTRHGKEPRETVIRRYLSTTFSLGDI